jgi:hypothetical protein
VVIEKASAKKLSWAGWTYSFAKKRKVYGLHVVVLLWCSSDGELRVPVAFRLWRPKRSCSWHAYRTKLRLAEVMLKEVVGWGLRPEYNRPRHPLDGRVVHQDGRTSGAGVGGDAPSEDDRLLERQAAFGGRVGQQEEENAFEVAKAPRSACCGGGHLRSQVRYLAVGRDQKPSLQP